MMLLDVDSSVEIPPRPRHRTEEILLEPQVPDVRAALAALPARVPSARGPCTGRAAETVHHAKVSVSRPRPPSPKRSAKPQERAVRRGRPPAAPPGSTTTRLMLVPFTLEVPSWLGLCCVDNSSSPTWRAFPRKCPVSSHGCVNSRGANHRWCRSQEMNVWLHVVRARLSKVGCPYRLPA